LKLIGLTGGIASGKSTIAAWLRKAGIPVVDADQLSRDAVAPGSPALARIVERFGDEILLPDGGLDRKKLGAIVFADARARADLNAIVHPEVGALALSRLDELRAAGVPVAVYEVPLLFENHLDQMMDGTLLVAASEPVQLRRLMERDGIDEAAARARMGAQMPLDEKRRRATAVVENDGSREESARQLRAAWRTLTGADVAFAA
jgi:dephospho-CoA kinase